jgi:hypothetical protein
VVRAALLVLSLAACGGAGAPAGPAPQPDPAPPPSSRITLYRDGAVVEAELRARVVPGTNVIALPAGRWAGAPQIEILGDPVALAVEAPTGAARARTVAENLAGTKVRVRSRGRAVEGELVTAGAGGVAVRTVAGETVLLPAGAVVEVDPTMLPVAGQRRSLRVRAERAGEVRLRIAYLTWDLRWRAGYGLVVDPGAASASLQGWLVIEDDAGAELGAAELRVVDGTIHNRAGVVAGAATQNARHEARRGTPEATAPADTAPPAPIALAPGVRLGPDARGHLELVGEAGRRIPARVRMVYDPGGGALTRPGRRPLARRDHGADLEGPVSFTVELDLEAAGIDPAGLPPGPVRVYQRDAQGVLMPVGHGTLGGTEPAAAAQTQPTGADAAGAGTDSAPDAAGDDTDSDAGPARVTVAMGRSPLVRASRAQTDFAYEPEHRRLVEEIRVTLDNRGDQPVEVDVVEHLYRGMNWTMAYYNRVGTVEKVGSQEVRFTIPVPGRGQVELVYRVVYTW